MNILISNNQDTLPINPSCVTPIVSSALKHMNATCAEISIQFVTKEEIGILHEDFFDDPSPTDCITFPIDPPGPEALLGEVFVCPEVAQEYAAEHGGDSQTETILYICHGILHLLGYDDIEEKDQKEMRKYEAFLMEHLKKENLLHLS